jgi:hypothetical protein
LAEAKSNGFIKHDPKLLEEIKKKKDRLKELAYIGNSTGILFSAHHQYRLASCS